MQAFGTKGVAIAGIRHGCVVVCSPAIDQDYCQHHAHFQQYTLPLSTLSARMIEIDGDDV